MKRYPALILLIILLIIPSVTIAEDVKIETGYQLYLKIKNSENASNLQNVEDILDSAHVLGYLKGFIDAVTLVQDFMYETVFPSKILSEPEREKLAKEMNFLRINIPEPSLAVGQVTLIFKKYAENHPERLNETARSCLLDSIIEAYGWK